MMGFFLKAYKKKLFQNVLNIKLLILLVPKIIFS